MGIATAQNPDFRNVAQQAGLTTPIPNGGGVSKQFIIETTGSGVAFIDYDNDGLADIFIASGPGSPSRMYHNEGGGKFRDVSESLGFTRQGWAQGVCAGDYDNDGYTDLFVTYWGQNALYRNIGGAASRTSPRKFISPRTASAITPAAHSSITIMTENSTSLSRII